MSCHHADFLGALIRAINEGAERPTSPDPLAPTLIGTPGHYVPDRTVSGHAARWIPAVTGGV